MGNSDPTNPPEHKQQVALLDRQVPPNLSRYSLFGFYVRSHWVNQIIVTGDSIYCLDIAETVA
jgi:hypothetical protein